MDTFRVEATVSHLQDRKRSVTLDLLVDTGTTYTTLPREVADALGLQPVGPFARRLIPTTFYLVSPTARGSV